MASIFGSDLIITHGEFSASLFIHTIEVLTLGLGFPNRWRGGSKKNSNGNGEELPLVVMRVEWWEFKIDHRLIKRGAI